MAVLPRRVRETLDTTATEAKLSLHTVKKQLRRHPEIKPSDYRLAQSALDIGRMYPAGKERHVVLFHDEGTLFEAVFKTSTDRREVFLQSLFVSHARRERGAQKRKQ